ncbi:MAG TPA: hypothetical protein VJ201_00465, partial [Candidatus Babeliales bacterium]|nr:hypothetical protein [Candidatus Babeliales bacterium]
MRVIKKCGLNSMGHSLCLQKVLAVFFLLGVCASESVIATCSSGKKSSGKTSICSLDKASCPSECSSKLSCSKVECETKVCKDPSSSCKVCPGTARSFLGFRGISTDMTLTNALGEYHKYHNNYTDRAYKKPEQRALFTMDDTYFYQATTDSEHLARYYQPGRKAELSLRESGDGDLGSLWFELVAGDRNAFYESILQMRPQRRTYGAMFSLHWDLHKWYDGLWLSAYCAAVSANHKLNFTERR